MIEPIDPFERRVFHGIDVPPRTTLMDHFRLVEPDDRLSEGVVVRVANAADGGLGAGFGKPFGIANRKVLAAPTGLFDCPR